MTTTTVEDKYELYGPGAKLLYKCGWQQGQKLGRYEQGLSKPISVTKRQDRVGLGAEQKTIWNDLWWERYLSEAISKNLEGFQDCDKRRDSDEEYASKENLFSRNEPRKKKKKSCESEKMKKRALKKKDKKKRKNPVCR